MFDLWNVEFSQGKFVIIYVIFWVDLLEQLYICIFITPGKFDVDFF